MGAGLREHILGVSGRYQEGVVVCYEVAGVPRTNNAMEGLFGQMRQRARRQTGYKQVGRVLQRQGAWLVYACAGTVGELTAEFGQVGAKEYAAEWARWEERQERFRRRYRWQREQEAVLAGLEARWTALGANSTL